MGGIAIFDLANRDQGAHMYDHEEVVKHADGSIICDHEVKKKRVFFVIFLYLGLSPISSS